MRLKTFTAPTMSDAMAMVRGDMGPDAIIVATQDGRDGTECRVTAAVEDRAPEPIIEDAPPSEVSPLRETQRDPAALYDSPRDPAALYDSPRDPAARDSYLRHALIAHGLPFHMVRVVMDVVVGYPDAEPLVALAAAIDTLGKIRPLDIRAPLRPLLLAGAPGAGKTIVAAKLAAQAKLAGRKPYIATTDTKRAGGIEQLEAYTRILGIDLATLDTPAKLAEAAPIIAAADVAIIDTAGVNAFDTEDLAALEAIAKQLDAEPLLVLAAGGDALDSADMAAAFHDIGAWRMIVTRIDMTRRLGGILAAMIGGRIAIAGAGVNPGAAEGLQRLNPVTLAGLILPETGAPATKSTRTIQ